MHVWIARAGSRAGDGSSRASRDARRGFGGPRSGARRPAAAPAAHGCRSGGANRVVRRARCAAPSRGHRPPQRPAAVGGRSPRPRAARGSSGKAAPPKEAARAPHCRVAAEWEAAIFGERHGDERRTCKRGLAFQRTRAQRGGARAAQGAALQSTAGRRKARRRLQRPVQGRKAQASRRFSAGPPGARPVPLELGGASDAQAPADAEVSFVPAMLAGMAAGPGSGAPIPQAGP